MLQESGAEIYQIPIFQKKEYTLTSEQINKIFNVDRLVFCSAESVDILVQSCSKYHKDIRSLTGRASVYEPFYSRKAYAIWIVK